MLKRTHKAVDTLRGIRKGNRGVRSTEELVAISRFGTMGQNNPTPPPEPNGRKRPSKVRIAVPPGGTEFKATLAVARRLASLSEETEGHIACMRTIGQENHCDECNHKCDNLKAIWLRVQVDPPPIRVETRPLEDVLTDRPIIVVIDDDDIPEGAVPGYHKVNLNDTCFLLRMNGEGENL
jgi:hypothetical protein